MRRRWGLPSYYVFLATLLYIPIAILFLFAFNDGTALSFPMQGFTFDWYRSMFDNQQLLAAARSSVVVAIGTATVATGLGTGAALAFLRFDFPGKQALAAATMLPLLVPFLILGVSLLILFSALDIPRSLLTVAVGHTVIAIPYTLLVMGARLADFPASLEEAARDLGATYPYTLRRVLIPILAPAMISAWLLAFTVSIDEFVIASFMIGREPTLPVYIFGQLRFANRFPQVVALSTVVIVLSVGLLLLAERLRRTGSDRVAAQAEG